MNGWSEALRQQLQPDVRVIVIEPGAVATELPDHITHGETRSRPSSRCYAASSPITADDIAQIIAFAVSKRPRSVSLNEIRVRPTAAGARDDLHHHPEQRRRDARARASASSRPRPRRPSPPSRPRWRPATGTSTPPPPTATSARSARPSAAPGVDRDEVFIETKVWISDYGYDATLHAFDKSAGKLGVDQIDLLILHQALPGRSTCTIDAYRALEKLLADGKVRAIGVSNFMPEHLDRLLAETAWCRRSTRSRSTRTSGSPRCSASHAEHGILTQAWSPIGGITFYRDGEHSSTLEDPTHRARSPRTRQDAAQVMLRWHLQQGRSAIPKSVKPARIAENFDVFDFELTADAARRHRRARHRRPRRPGARQHHPRGVRPEIPEA